MFQSDGQSKARAPVFKSLSKLDTHLSIHCTGLVWASLEAAQQYVDDILRTVLLPFNLQYPVLNFQQILPDHIRHDMMGRRLYLPGNVDDLVRELEQIWQEILHETIGVLYHSMPRRVAACIRSRVGSTPF
ncbi:transposable element Tcb1 transposase [Trichonephila clavipes]|uniref:Transposable element Tcb1 transposase n=1 Tax=Trichonephila clavipes TaxID=2585209 RepID=A0A8X6VMG7_TRICX|nr:transposable element Tcb1 transposase [Trichonephila clavipes]